MNIVFCSSCNKQITNTDNDSIIKSAVCWSFTAVSANDQALEYLKSQFGQYNPCKTYNICYECVLRSFGAKP